MRYKDENNKTGRTESETVSNGRNSLRSPKLL
jgi:hypothetical protein